MRILTIILSLISINAFGKMDTKQFNDLKSKAEQGDPKAQYDLALQYLLDYMGPPENKTESFKWYNKSANQGYAKAQKQLGDAYFMGMGVAENKVEAIKWYLKAANQGDTDAQETLADRYISGDGVSKNIAEGLKWYRKSADQGSITAQSSLGYFYGTGQKVTKNQSEAVKWWRKAADQGDKDSQYYLGVCYAKGNGVAKNLTEAVKWYTKSAEQGNLIAQLNLGLCYANGIGVQKNIVEAYAWSGLLFSTQDLMGFMGLTLTETDPSFGNICGVSYKDRFLSKELYTKMSATEKEAGKKRMNELKAQIDAKTEAQIDAIQKKFDGKN